MKQKILVNTSRKTILLAISLSFSLNAYQLSDGVPDPLNTWAPQHYTGDIVHPITGEAPESWEVATNLGLAAYYIDSQHSLATNEDNPFGSPDKPRSTIPEKTYEAGSYVEIKGGPYDGGGQLFITADGTPAKPVWVRGSSYNDKALINGQTIIKGQYVILENIEFRSLGFRTHKESVLHHAVIRNSSFTGDGTSGGSSSAIAIYSSSSSNRYHDLIVYNNNISKFGDDYDDVDPSASLSTENDYHGVITSTNVDRVWILNNKIYNMGGDSVQVGKASISDENRVSHVYIANNDFYTNLENGVDVKEADNTLIIGNRLWDWKKHKGNGSTGTAIIIHNGADKTWVINNEVSDAAGGIAATDRSLNTWVIGNVIKDINHSDWEVDWSGGLYDSGGAIHFRGGSTGGALNNTIINYDKGIEVASGQYVFINNILFNRTTEQGYDFFVESSKSNNFTSNNLVFSNSVSFKQKNVSCASCIYEDPSFIDLSHNAAISDNSVVIAAGIGIQNYLNKYKSIFGVELNKDIYNGDRIVGGIEIGAMEDQNSLVGGDKLIPLSPDITNIKINE